MSDQKLPRLRKEDGEDATTSDLCRNLGSVDKDNEMTTKRRSEPTTGNVFDIEMWHDGLDDEREGEDQTFDLSAATVPMDVNIPKRGCVAEPETDESETTDPDDIALRNIAQGTRKRYPRGLGEIDAEDPDFEGSTSDQAAVHDGQFKDPSTWGAIAFLYQHMGNSPTPGCAPERTGFALFDNRALKEMGIVSSKDTKRAMRSILPGIAKLERQNGKYGFSGANSFMLDGYAVSIPSINEYHWAPEMYTTCETEARRAFDEPSRYAERVDETGALNRGT